MASLPTRTLPTPSLHVKDHPRMRCVEDSYRHTAASKASEKQPLRGGEVCCAVASVM